MHPPQNATHEEDAKRGVSSSTASNENHLAYMSGHEALFDLENLGVTGRIVVHPLFEKLLEAHVACLRVAAPLQQQHIIDSALASQHHVSAKYLDLLSHFQSSSSHPAENEELTHFMENYTVLLQCFKDRLLEHLNTEASEAMSACHEIQQALFNLTGVSSSSYASSMTQTENKHSGDGDFLDNGGLGRSGISAFSPYDVQKVFREHVRRGLKQELKQDYASKLKEARDEIVRKRRAGKLPEGTRHRLRDWWLSHAKWPYPTEEEKAQLAKETGLDLKHINNWFINQRKNIWKGKNVEADTMDII